MRSVDNNLVFIVPYPAPFEATVAEFGRLNDESLLVVGPKRPGNGVDLCSRGPVLDHRAVPNAHRASSRQTHFLESSLSAAHFVSFDAAHTLLEAASIVIA